MKDKDALILAKLNTLIALQAKNTTAGDAPSVDFISEQFDHGDTGSSVGGVWEVENTLRVQNGRLFGSGGYSGGNGGVTFGQGAYTQSTSNPTNDSYVYSFSVNYYVYMDPPVFSATSGGNQGLQPVQAKSPAMITAKTIAVARPAVKLSSSEFTVSTKFEVQNAGHSAAYTPSFNYGPDRLRGDAPRTTIAGLWISEKPELDNTSAMHIVFVAAYVSGGTFNDSIYSSEYAQNPMTATMTVPPFMTAMLVINGEAVNIGPSVNGSSIATGSGTTVPAIPVNIPVATVQNHTASLAYINFVSVGENELKAVSSNGYIYVYVNDVLVHTSRKNEVASPAYVGYSIPACTTYTPNSGQNSLWTNMQYAEPVLYGPATHANGCYNFKAWVNTVPEPLAQSGYGKIVDGRTVWLDKYHEGDAYNPNA